MDTQMRFRLTLLLFGLIAAPLSNAQDIEDTNGDGVADADDEPQMPKLVASTPKIERENKLVPGVYVSVSEIRGFHWSYLHARNGIYKFNVFGCTGGFSDNGTVALSEGWFSAGGSYWHPGKMNGRNILWRGDAWELWTTEHKLYDYGILVRVAGDDPIKALKDSPSVECLYEADIKGKLAAWRDPFVYGPRDLKPIEEAEPSDAPKDRASSIDNGNSSDGPR
jgi:hypothetical protein